MSVCRWNKIHKFSFLIWKEPRHCWWWYIVNKRYRNHFPMPSKWLLFEFSTHTYANVCWNMEFPKTIHLVAVIHSKHQNNRPNKDIAYTHPFVIGLLKGTHFPSIHWIYHTQIHWNSINKRCMDDKTKSKAIFKLKPSRMQCIYLWIYELCFRSYKRAICCFLRFRFSYLFIQCKTQHKSRTFLHRKDT